MVRSVPEWSEGRKKEVTKPLSHDLHAKSQHPENLSDRAWIGSPALLISKDSASSVMPWYVGGVICMIPLLLLRKWAVSIGR